MHVYMSVQMNICRLIRVGVDVIFSRVYENRFDELLAHYLSSCQHINFETSILFDFKVLK